MICPKCSSLNCYVIDSREVKDIRRRRYECSDCKLRFTTVELHSHKYNEIKRYKDTIDKIKKLTK